MARAEVDRAAMNLQQSQITSGNQQSSGTILDVIAAIVNMATVVLPLPKAKVQRPAKIVT